jgi:hypothetical protein
MAPVDYNLFKKTNGPFYALIEAFHELTDVPMALMALNTSFNENEPVVRKPSEALGKASAKWKRSQHVIFSKRAPAPELGRSACASSAVFFLRHGLVI